MLTLYYKLSVQCLTQSTKTTNGWPWTTIVEDHIHASPIILASLRAVIGGVPESGTMSNR